MKTSYVVIAIVIIVVIGGLFFYMSQQGSPYQQPSPAQTPNQQTTSQPPTQRPSSQAPQIQTLKTISMSNFSFQPTALTATLGTTVVWTNNDSSPHTITADDGSFDSGTIVPGGTFRHTFTVVGTQDYHCKFHGSMHGSIVVEK